MTAAEEVKTKKSQKVNGYISLWQIMQEHYVIVDVIIEIYIFSG